MSGRIRRVAGGEERAMYVSEVLKRKGSRVEKARPDMPVGDAIQALRSKGIGAEFREAI